MKTTTLPSQSDIETFLGKDFFPAYPNPVYILEVVDVVQLQFEVSEDDRKAMCPKAHGTDGTVLECLTNFAMLRLQECGYLRRIGKNTFKWNGVRMEKVNRKEVEEARISLKLLKESGISDPEEAIIMLCEKWSEPVLRAAAKKLLWNTN